MIRQTIAAAVLLALVGSGCSFRPLHRSGPAAGDLIGMSFDVAEPNSRLEQIVYRELTLGDAKAQQLNRPALQVVATSSTRAASLSATPATRRGGVAVGSAQTMEVTVTVTALIMEGGKELFQLTRFASALYNSNRDDDSNTPVSVLAASAAEQRAQEDAARAAAQSLRMALLARLAS